MRARAGLLRLVQKSLLSMMIFCAVSASAAGNDKSSDSDKAEHMEWKLVKEKGGVQIYSKPVVGSPINAIRAKTIVDSGLHPLASVLYDPKLRPDWDEMCSESYVYKRVSGTEYLTYNHTELPWPIKDRDIVARVIWSQEPVSLKVTMQSNATADLMPGHKDRVRVTVATETWELLPLDNGKIELTLSVHADPAGPIPVWLINRLSVESPYNMMMGIKELLENPKFEHREFDFIQEPKKV